MNSTVSKSPAAGRTFLRVSMPWGLNRRCGHRVLFSDGVIRAVECAQTADTFFSIPATARIRGHRITGYVTSDERESDGARVLSFRPHDGQEALHGLPAWPDSFTPEQAALLANG